MADPAPSTTPFKLPDDVHVLAHLRDQLSDYLATLERNTDSIREWLDAQQNSIIVGHHRLVRAITFEKDEEKALKVLDTLGETAGFILNMQDFAALAASRFGAGSKIATAIAAVPHGFPADILEDLPAVRVPKPGDTVEAIGLNTRIDIPPAPEDDAKKGFWASLGGMFKGTDPEEEARRKEEAIKRHWRNLRGELISLQSDRHYYIDSFMDWVGENLEPEEPESPTPVLMHQYQNPQYVIDLAQRDYAEVNQGRATRLNAQALDYSALARTLDTQDIAAFIKMMPALFPREETPESIRIKKLLLTDFNVGSFAELALTHVKKDEDRIALLSSALSHEPKFEIAGLKSDTQIFERVLGEVLKPAPLNPVALELTLHKLRGDKKAESSFHLLQLYAPNNTTFSRIAARFSGNPAQIAAVTAHLLAGLGAKNPALAAKVGEFAAAAREKNPDAMLRTLRGIAAGDRGHAFMALWQLTYPGQSLVEKMVETGASPAMLSLLSEALIDAGMHDEWRAESHAFAGSAAKALGFIRTHVIPGLSSDQPFSLGAARRILAAGFTNGGLDALRAELTRSGGWLEQAAISPKLSDAEKISWIAALIEPYASGILRANILHDAAEKASGIEAAKILSGIEAAFTGDNIRLDDDRLLTNLHRIANIWYNPEPKTLRFTVNGNGQLLQENVSQHMADETLTLIRRKGGFLYEYDGLVKPENIDRIITTPQGTKIGWQRHSGDFNGTAADAQALHRRPDFLHEDHPQEGETFSINQKSVLLLQPLEDGTHLLIDTYGAAQILEGKIRLDAQPPLLDLGGLWFNPHAASILSLDPEKATLEFRAESKEFDTFLEQAENGEYLYTLQLPDRAAAEKIGAAITKDTGFALPLEGAGSLALNLRALGYLAYYADSKDGEAGFACRKYGPTRKPGFVRTEDPDFAAALFEGLRKSPGVICAGNLVVHKSMIEDAYYNAEKNTFYMIVGQEVLSTEIDAAEAYALLGKLATEKGFETVGTSLVNDAAPGTGMVEAPADVINLSRASLIAYNPAQGQAYIHTDHDQYHVNLDRQWTQELLRRLEEKGRKEAVRKTAGMPWVRDLEKTLAQAPSFDVTLKPALTDEAPHYLLAQALGARQESRKLPTLNADFSVAAAPLSTGDTIRYPHNRRPAPRTGTGGNPRMPKF